MKKTIILMLLAMAAFSFTACDSLIPNDLPTEEENTPGGNDNPGGSDGTEDEGGSGNIEDEDPTPEMKGCNPCVNFGRLVKEMTFAYIDNGELNGKWIFEYDAFGRYSRIYDEFNLFELTDFSYSETMFSCVYNNYDDRIGGNLSAQDRFTFTTDKDGNVTSIEMVRGDIVSRTAYTYASGYVTGVEDQVSGIDPPSHDRWNCVWENSNLISGGLGWCMLDNVYSYTDKENRMNIGIYDVEFPLRLKGLSSADLIESTDYASYTYTFDNDGYIVSMTDGEDNYDYFYTFTYYE